MKRKHLKQTIISSIFALLILMVCVFAPTGAKTQITEYRNTQNQLFGTSDSRMVFSVEETDDHVKLRIMMIGEVMLEGSMGDIVYDSLALILMDSTYTKTVLSFTTFDKDALSFEPSFAKRYANSAYKLSSIYHNPLYLNTGYPSMKALNNSIFTLENYTKWAYFLPGEMVPIYSIYFKKRNPGTPLNPTDIGFLLQKAPKFSARISVFYPQWMGGGASITYYGGGAVQTLEYEHPEQFVFRSPSSVKTNPVTNIASTAATLNGNFKRGTWDPSSQMIQCGMETTTRGGLLDYDAISQYGFIYSDIDAEITVKEFADTIIINGISYAFPTPAEIMTGSFTRDTLTFNIIKEDNSVAGKSVDYNMSISGLTLDQDYYVWSFKRYSFQTSNTFPEVGNKVIFRTAANCEAPITLASQTFCGTPAPTVADLYAQVADTNNTLVWTDTAGTVLDPTDFLVDGATYYVKAIGTGCTSDSIEVTVSVINEISAPKAKTPQTFCAGGFVSNLRVEGTNIQWYLTPTGGSPIVGDPALEDGQIYYASQSAGLGLCESGSRTAVKVIITDETGIEPPVISTPQRFCNYATLADISTDGSDIVWYSASGALLPSNTYLTNNTTYYAAKVSGTCESTQRTPVLVYTGLTTPDPIVIASPQRFCFGATLANIAVPGNQIEWYASATDSIKLPTNSLLGHGVTYYAAQKAGECESTVRTPVLIILDGMQGPEAPSTQIFCGTGYTLADLTITGNAIVWYSSMTGNTVLPSSTLLASTPSTYYAANKVGACESSRIGVTAYASPTPTVAVRPLAICDDVQIFDLTAGITPAANVTYIYYSDMLGTVIANPTMLAVPTVNTIYYVKATNTLTGCVGDYTEIQVIINHTPQVSANPPGAYTSIRGTTTVEITDDNTNLAANAKTVIIRDTSIASITFANGVITVTGKKKGNTEIVYTSTSEGDCKTEYIIPVQIEGSPTGILLGKDIVKCNVPGGGDTTIVQIGYIMGGIAPWTVTISDDRGMFTRTITINSIDDLPVDVVANIPENTSNVPEFTNYTITNIVDAMGANKQTHYGVVRIGTNPTPKTNIIANKYQTVCAGKPTLPVSFSGVSTIYRWNIDENIGLINYSNDGIPSFVAINTTDQPITAKIVVIPEYWYNGVVCIGESDTATIVVYPSLIADFTTELSGLGKVTFTDRTLDAVSWSWNFGDGTTETAQNPTHEYTRSGTYMVTLTVTSVNGCTATVARRVSVSTTTDLQARFDVSETVQCLSGNLFVFNNTSSITTPNYSIGSYKWYFGDGDSATTKNAMHTYLKDSIYTVTLVVTETPGGTQSSYSQTVRVLGVPEIANNANPQAICEGNRLQVRIPTIDWKGNAQTTGTWMLDGNIFDPSTMILMASDSGKTLKYQVAYSCGVTSNTGEKLVVYKNPVADFSTTVVNTGMIKFTDRSSNAVSWSWNFGDGSTSASENPSHQYAQSGSYTVSLTATSAGGCTSTITKVVYVSTTTDLQARFDVSETVQCLSGNLFVFNNTSLITTPNHSISSYKWYFGDGDSATTKNATHTYIKDSTYIVTLIVTETPGGTQSSYSQTLRVLGVPEIANNANPQAVCEGTRLQVRIPTIDWKGNTPITGTWMLDGNIFDPSTMILMASDSGKTLKYQVAYSCGVTSNTGEKLVVYKSPAADFSTTVVNTGMIKFTDRSSNAVSWSWNFGDGSTSASQNPSHQYAQSGSYIVSLTATSAGGCVSTITKEVYVSTTTDLQARFDVNQTVQCLSGNLFVFNNTSSITTPNHSISSYKWYFGDGDSATTKNATHTYIKDSTYIVTLIVTETPGGTQSSYSQTLRVLGVPMITDTATVAAVCEGERLQVRMPAIDWKGNTPVTGQWLLNGNVFDPVVNTLTAQDNGKTLQYRVSLLCGTATSTGRAIVVKEKPVMGNILDATYCAGVQISAKTLGNASGITYQWKQMGDNIGLTTLSGNDVIPAFQAVNNGAIPLTAIFEVTASNGSCQGNTVRFSITVNPRAKVSSDLVVAPICSGSNFRYAIQSLSEGAHFTWKRLPQASINNGNTNSSASSTIEEVLSNTGATPVEAQYEITTTTSVCSQGYKDTVRVTVNPMPNVTNVQNFAYCHGEEVSAYTFIGNVPGSVFNWEQTVSGGNNGMATRGTDSIPVFIANNTTTSPITSTYKVKTVYVNGSSVCNGEERIFTVTVNPRAKVSSDLVVAPVCSGSNFRYVIQSLSEGAHFTWKRLPQASINNGNTNSSASSTIEEVLSNTGATPVEVQYEITTTTSVCSQGYKDTVRVTVNPMPNVTNVQNFAYCHGEEVSAYTFIGNVPGSVFNWEQTVSGGNNGMATRGTDSIPAFVANNTTLLPITSTYKVKTVYVNGSSVCSGEERIFTVTVNPELKLASATEMGEICSDTRFNYTARSNVNNISFSWKRPAVAGINNGAEGNGSGAIIDEVLYNHTSASITVNYMIEMIYGNCKDTAYVTVVVKPTPEITIQSVVEACMGDTKALLPYTLSSSQQDLAVQYSITFNETALLAGFKNVNNIDLSGDTIAITLPRSLVAGSYGATLSVNVAGGCASTVTHPFYIQVMEGVQITKQPESVSLCGTDGFTLSVTAIGKDLNYKWYHNNQIIQGATSSVYTVDVSDSATHYGNYYVVVTGACGSETSKTVEVGRNGLVLLTKWTDVIFISNKEKQFVSYQWYKDEKSIAVEGNYQSYVEKGGLDGTYQVLVTYADGSKEMSCPYTVHKATHKRQIAIYPNPVASNEDLIVDLSQFILGEFENAKLDVFDMSGKQIVRMNMLTSKQRIRINAPKGTYVLRITTAQNEVITEKIIVR